MTKTSKAAKITKTATTRDGVQGYRIECPCGSHAGYGNAAFVPFEIRNDRIHGFVLLANHPAEMMRRAQARKGVYAA